MSSTTEEAAALLFAARRDLTLLTDLPACLRPATIEEAYAIQDAGVRRLGEVHGWKVGPARNGDEPRCSPLTARPLGSPALLPDAGPAPLELELELAVTLAAGLPPRDRAYGVEDVAAATGSLHLAFELIGSRFEDRRRVSPLTAVADQQSNAGVVIGPGLTAWRDLDLSAVGLTLAFDDEQVAAKNGDTTTPALLELVAWLANHAAARGVGLRAGQVVITGARLGPCPVPAAGLAQGSGPPFEPVRFRSAWPDGARRIAGEPT